MKPGRAFSLIELLVVIAVAAVLLSLLLPTLGQVRLTARATACGSRLQQIGIGLGLYFNDFDRTLPQALGPLPEGGTSVIGALFAGTKGRLPFYGIDTIGAARRPLNAYVIARDVPPDDSGQTVDLEEFRSPVDKGAERTGVPIPSFDKAESMYRFVGASYTLNDRSLLGDRYPTLIPRAADGGGGRMPEVLDTTKTWVIATHTIYNFEQDGDRGMYWFGRRGVEANMLFVDLHVRVRVPVPNEPGVVEDTTPHYTFLPQPLRKP